MKIVSQHRSLSLAHGKRKRLERKHGISFEITDRRNAKGHFSPRGQFFTFESKTKQYLISLQFSKGKDRRELHVEAVMRAESIEQVKEQIESGMVAPKSFIFVQWRHGAGHGRRSRSIHDFTQFLSIATRYEIKKHKAKNRRNKK